MLKKEAENKSRSAGREKHFLPETWYCGIINQKINAAAETGQYEAKIRFSAGSYVARHQQRFTDLYEALGYEVTFRPNYVHIEPSMWDMIVRWFPEEEKKNG